MSKYDDSIRSILEGANLPHNCTIRYFAQTVSDADKIKLAQVLLESCQKRPDSEYGVDWRLHNTLLQIAGLVDSLEKRSS